MTIVDRLRALAAEATGPLPTAGELARRWRTSVRTVRSAAVRNGIALSRAPVGGPMPGSGRPALGNRAVKATITQGTYDALRAAADAQGVTPSEIAASVLSGWAGES